MLADHPLSLPSLSPHWHCTACGSLYPAATVEAWLSAARTSLSSSSSSVEQCEESLHLLSARLHPGHLLLLQLKQKLAGLYGSSSGLSRPARERRLQLLMDLVESNSKVSAQIFCINVVFQMLDG